MNGPDIEIKIGTTAETKGIKETEKALGGLGIKAQEAGAGVGKIGLSVAQLGADMLPGIAAVASLAGALKLAKDAVTEFADTEEQLQGLAQAVANQGQLTQKYADELAELGNAMENATGIAKGSWFKALEELTKHGANSANIKAYTKAVSDLAGLIGTDVESASRLFTRAMDGNYEMLRRYGINVREGATATEALGDIMRQAAERGGGILEARMKTLNGQILQVKNGFGDLMEKAGGFIAHTHILQISMALTTSVFDTLLKRFPDYQQELDGVRNRATGAAGAIRDTGSAATASAEGMDAATTAAGKLKDSYDKAASSASKFRSEQDQLINEAVDTELSEIDLKEAQGLLSPTDAKLARAGVKLKATEEVIAANKKTIDQQIAQLRGDTSASESKSLDAEKAAEPKLRERDELRKLASAALGLTPEQVADPKQFETAFNKAREELALQKSSFRSGPNAPLMQRQQEAARTAQLRDLERLPEVTAEAGSAEAAAAAAKRAYNQTSTETGPRIGELEQKRNALEYLLQRERNVNARDVINAQKDRAPDERPSNWQAMQSASAGGTFKNIGDAMHQNGRFIEQNGSEFLQIVRSQNRLFQDMIIETRKLRADQETLRRQVGKLRNP